MALPLSTLITPHFEYRELVTTARRDLLAQNAAEGEQHLTSLEALCWFLEKVREHFGRPVIVHSAFRCKTLNSSIPGASRVSQHMKGQAADFHVSGVGLEEAWTWIRDESDLPFGQLILEGRAGIGEWGWIHLSLGEPWRPAARCRQAFKLEV